MKDEKQKIITIDGPSGSGKGTIAMIVARKLGFNYLDSGALYRTFAYFLLKNKIDLNNVVDIENCLKDILKIREELTESSIKIYLGDEEISQHIRTEECAGITAKIAELDIVRNILLKVQRDFYDEKIGLVCDGRDMGSTVFPEAKLKVFLTASPEIRAKRRLLQLESLEIKENFENILEKIKKRDYNDENRANSPLVCPTGAIVVDSTSMSINEVSELVVSLAIANF